MTFRYYNKEIEGLRSTAKTMCDFTDKKLAETLKIGKSTITNKSSKKTLPMMRFWDVAKMAKLAGKKIVFVDEQ